MLNIARETREFFSVLVRATPARRVLEIGTSNGYSTLWLAETVELSEYKTELARLNLKGYFLRNTNGDEKRWRWQGRKNFMSSMYMR